MQRLRTRRALVALAVAVTAIVGAVPHASAQSNSGSKATSTEPYTVRVGFISTGSVLGGAEGYGLKYGTFAQDLAKGGITVETIPFAGGGPPAAQAFAAGELDVVFFNEVTALISKSNGLDTRLLNTSQVGMDPWLIGRADGPKTVKELAGKKVGVLQGAFQEIIGKRLVEKAGLKVDDVQWVFLPNPAQVPALERGEIDASVQLPPVAVALEDRGYNVIAKPSESAPELEGVYVSLVSPKFLAAHPDFPAKWEAARAKAVKLIQEKEADYDRFMSVDFYGGAYTVDQVKPYLPADTYQLEPYSKTAIKNMKKSQKWLLANHISQAPFNFNQWLVKYPSASKSA